MSDKLKPCPFCGGEPSIIGERCGFGPWKAVVAHTCGLAGQPFVAEEKAVQDWNRRADYVKSAWGDVGLKMRDAWNRSEK